MHRLPFVFLNAETFCVAAAQQILTVDKTSICRLE
jgi:hypothetical protein